MEIRPVPPAAADDRIDFTVAQLLEAIGSAQTIRLGSHKNEAINKVLRALLLKKMTYEELARETNLSEGWIRKYVFTPLQSIGRLESERVGKISAAKTQSFTYIYWIEKEGEDE